MRSSNRSSAGSVEWIGRSTRPARSQRGAAALIVVMLLFFVISLVAAYTSRNLIFEQRTATNQYRSTQALEAADAGLEWALAMLNSGRIDEQCEPTTDTSLSTFRTRYLQDIPIEGSNAGQLTPRVRTGAAAGRPLLAGCVFNGTSWACRCPSAGDAGNLALAAPDETGSFPMFRVQFRNVSAHPITPTALPAGVVRIDVHGCTRADVACLQDTPEAPAGDSISRVVALAALKSALPAPPAAALTASLVVHVTGAPEAVNTSLMGHGYTIHAGDSINHGSWTLIGLPAEPARFMFPDENLKPDALPTVLTTTGDRFFASIFGMRPSVYSEQPAALRLYCSESPNPCVAAIVADLAALNPNRVIWIAGDLELDAAVTIGSPSEPVMLVVEGDVNTSATDPVILGALYVRDPDWAITGAPLIIGAAIAEGDVSGIGEPRFVYDDEILRRLRWTSGSFVRVPGSWRDF